MTWGTNMVDQINFGILGTTVVHFLGALALWRDVEIITDVREVMELEAEAVARSVPAWRTRRGQVHLFTPRFA